MKTASDNVDWILARALDGERISERECLSLLEHGDLISLGHVADTLCRRKHPAREKTYILDRNVNYTNVCVVDCGFCAFYRRPGDREAYTHHLDVIFAKVEELMHQGGRAILLQGGLNPALPFEYYPDLLKALMDRFPDLYIHGFSPPELSMMVKISKRDIGHVLQTLKDAGLRSIPGGGAEILVDRVRKIISPRKCMSEEWLYIMRQAHLLDIPSSATMMFGHVETLQERVAHLGKLRDLQDETGGFSAFIPWTFQPDHTQLHLPRMESHEFLVTLSASRIFLDNFPNIQASWVTQGPKIGQIALRFGANDFGSVLLEENVVSAAGARFQVPQGEMIRLIEDLGYRAVARDYRYNHV